MWVGVIEGGGTKFVCAVELPDSTLADRVVIPTRDPHTTLGACVDFLRSAASRLGPPAALGVACFGPLQLRRSAPDYGCVLHTPKAGWSGVNVLAPLREAIAVPIAFDTDVAAAALGELRCGAGRGASSLGYATVGTGIGAAVAPQVPGAQFMHAEMGHLAVRRDPRDAGFRGICPFHADCLEGLASGPAIRARWGCDLSALPAAHAGRQVIAGYLGQLAAAITLMHSPQVLVFGGGVMSDGLLLPQVRASTLAWLGGYLPHLRDQGQINAYLRPPGLCNDSALSGAAQMARTL
jgi:fructokinase